MRAFSTFTFVVALALLQTAFCATSTMVKTYYNSDTCTDYIYADVYDLMAVRQWPFWPQGKGVWGGLWRCGKWPFLLLAVLLPSHSLGLSSDDNLPACITHAQTIER